MPPLHPAAPQALAVQAVADGLWLAAAGLEAAARLAPVWARALRDAHGFKGLREQSFLAGRAVAAAVLGAMPGDAAGRVVDLADDGAPLWPEGIVGSIAHSAQQAVAVVGDTVRWRAVGVDVEPDAELPVDAAALVLTAEDRRALQHAFGEQAHAHTRLVFAAKECVHKALHPLRGAWLEFDEVAIEWFGTAAQGGRWRALAISEPAREAFGDLDMQGRWWRAEGSLWCLLALSR